MKNIYRLLIVLALLLLMGCSSNYTIKDFPSKDKFYQSFNTSVGYKDIDITLIDNSQHTIFGGGTLKQDTLYTLTNIFPVETIKNINFRTKGGGGSVLIGILSGAATELGIAYLYSKSHHFGESGEDIAIFANIVVLLPVSAIIGGVIGYFIGWNNTYQFNP